MASCGCQHTLTHTHNTQRENSIREWSDERENGRRRYTQHTQNYSTITFALSPSFLWAPKKLCVEERTQLRRRGEFVFSKVIRFYLSFFPRFLSIFLKHTTHKEGERKISLVFLFVCVCVCVLCPGCGRQRPGQHALLGTTSRSD
jgi:FtsH-binding integral membrane protein